MKITTRYTLYSLVASAIPLGLVVVVLLSFSRNKLKEMRADDVARVERIVRSSFESYEQEIRSGLEIISRDLEWTRLLLARDANGQIDQLSLIDLATSYSELPGLSYVELISVDSLLLARSGDYSNFNVEIERPALNAQDSTGTTSGLFAFDFPADSEVVVMASKHLTYKGDLIGYLQVGKAIDRAMLAHVEDMSGTLIDIVPLSVVSGAERSGGTVSRARDSIVVSDSLMIEFAGIDGSEIMIAMILMPESEIEQLLSRSLWIFAIVACAGVMLAGVLGYVGSRHLTVPIGELVEAAEGISRGQFERRIIWFAKDELGTLVEGFNTMYDRLKVSQERLVQSEKVAAWNQMARKVAHEIKNPLTPIQISVEDLKRSYDSNDPEFDQILGNAVDSISSEITRLKRLTEEFSRFARLPAPQLVRKDIRPVVADALRIYSDDVRSGRLRVRFPQDNVIVNIDADLFSQVMINLVKNSLESVDADGHVQVTGELGRGIVRVSIEDDGPGVPDEHVTKLFTPYFTTKKEGTGLGLVIAYRIVFDHGGRIRYEKRDHGGARFVIVLPLAEETS